VNHKALIAFMYSFYKSCTTRMFAR